MRSKLYTSVILIVLLTLAHVAVPRPATAADFAITSPKQEEKVQTREVAVRGTGAPGAKAIWDRGRLTGDVIATVDQGGKWSITVPLDKGRNEFTFRQENPDLGPVKLVVLYEVLPGAGTPTDTRVGIGPFSVDLSDWTLKFVYGAWNAAGGDEVEGIGTQLAALMLTNPDPTVAGGGMKSLQNVVDSLIAFSLSLITMMFVISVWRFSYGDLQQPQTALFRLAGAIFLLGFYRLLFRYIVGASNAATYTILGGPAVEGASVVQVFAHIVPTTALWAIVALVALVFVLMLGFLRVVGLLYILVLYVLGPLAIPMMMDKSTHGYFEFWWKSLVRALAVSVAWAVELRLFDAVSAMAVTGGVAEAFFAPIAAMGVLVVMFKTPKLLPGPTPSMGLQMITRQVTTHHINKALQSEGFKRAGATVGAAAMAAPTAVAHGATRAAGAVNGAARGIAGARRS
ncbi:MAG: hypothetical protein M3P51_04805 [Chloroflexota bacterium]|nr:hypothetical protein [Chloroflexota bacterium]